MNVTFNIKGYTDRRTPELVARYQLIEATRHALTRRQIQVVSGVADVGSGTATGAGDTVTRPARIWPATAGAPFRVVRVR